MNGESADTRSAVSPNNGGSGTDGTGENDSLSDSHSHSPSPSDNTFMGDKLLQKLQKGMNESLAVNYFKSKRRDVLLNKNGTNRHPADSGGLKGGSSSSCINNNNINLSNKNIDNVSNTLHGSQKDKLTSNDVIDLVKQSYNNNGDPKHVHSLIHGANDDDDCKSILSPVLRDNQPASRNSILSNVNKMITNIHSNASNRPSGNSDSPATVNSVNSTKNNRQSTVSLNSLMNGRSSHLHSPVSGKQDSNTALNQLKQGKLSCASFFLRSSLPSFFFHD